MHDDQTPHLALPLPHPANTFEVDVHRLRAALTALDARLHDVDALLHTEDVDLDTVAEIVAAVKLAHEDIAALEALIETEVGTQIGDVEARAGALEGRADALEKLIPLIYAGL